MIALELPSMSMSELTALYDEVVRVLRDKKNDAIALHQQRILNTVEKLTWSLSPERHLHGHLVAKLDELPLEEFLALKDSLYETHSRNQWPVLNGRHLFVSLTESREMTGSDTLSLYLESTNAYDFSREPEILEFIRTAGLKFDGNLSKIERYAAECARCVEIIAGKTEE